MHFRVAGDPTAGQFVQQLREVFPPDDAPRYLILDRDGKFGHEVPAAIRRMGIGATHFAARSPWQNDVAESFVSTVRRDLRQTPTMRPVNTRLHSDAAVVAPPRLGGLHYRHAWRVAA